MPVVGYRNGGDILTLSSDAKKVVKLIPWLWLEISICLDVRLFFSRNKRQESPTEAMVSLICRELSVHGAVLSGAVKQTKDKYKIIRNFIYSCGKFHSVLSSCMCSCSSRIRSAVDLLSQSCVITLTPTSTGLLCTCVIVVTLLSSFCSARCGK